jgi:hypothetical protein
MCNIIKSQETCENVSWDIRVPGLCAIVIYTSAAQRKPILPVELSGVLAVLAATR